MSSVFISHSSKNNAEALALRQWLSDFGIRSFLDIDHTDGLIAGDRWRPALIDAGTRAKAVVFVISPDWLTSQECHVEFAVASGLGKPLFGVIAVETPLKDIPAEMTAQWQLTDLISGSEFHSFHILAPPSYLPGEVKFSEEGLQSLRVGLLEKGLGSLDTNSFPWPAEGFETEADGTPRSPWRGLQALDEPDAGVFYGRDGEIHEGLDQIGRLRDADGSTFLVILGASGSGKSSFLRAGLVPRLKRLDGDYLVLPVIRPEAQVIDGDKGLLNSLHRSLNSLGVDVTRGDLRAELASDSGALSRRLAEVQQAASGARSDRSKPPTLIIPLDQAEELFSPGASETEPFITAVSEALRFGPECIVIATIRTDAYEPLQSNEKLRNLQSTVSLPPVDQTAYRSAIEGPIDRLKSAGRSLKFSPTLKHELVSASKGGDALPLLAFSLERLYRDYGSDGEISEADYKAMGGMQGAVEAAARAAFAQPLSAPNVPSDPALRHDLLRQLFPWLVRINEHNGAALKRVAYWQSIPDQAKNVAERLVCQRLLRSDVDEEGTRIVEIAHEALLRRWPTLTNWLDQERDNLRIVQSVERAALDWHQNKWLTHRAERLASAEQLAAERPDLAKQWGSVGEKYLLACRAEEYAEAEAEKARQKELLNEQRARADAEKAEASKAQQLLAAQQKSTRRAQVFLAIATALVVAVGIGAITAFQQRGEALTARDDANRQTDHALRTQSLFLADLSQQQLEQGHATTSLLLALEALPDDLDVPNRPFVHRAQTALYAAAVAVRELKVFSGHTDKINHVAFNPNGAQILTASDDNTARLWNIDSGTWTAFEGHTSSVSHAAFSSDGARVVTTSRYGRSGPVRIWDAKSGEAMHKISVSGELLSGRLTPDGRRIVTTSRFGSGSSNFGSINQTRRITDTRQLWDAVTGKRLFIMDQDTGTFGMFGNGGPKLRRKYSPDGSRFFTAFAALEIQLRDGETSELLQRFSVEQKTIQAAFDPDGSHLIATFRGGAKIWDTQSGQSVRIEPCEEGEYEKVSFSQDGSRVVAVQGDGWAEIWDTVHGKCLDVLPELKGSAGRVFFSPDGKRLLTTGTQGIGPLKPEGDFIIWNSETGSKIGVLESALAPFLIKRAIFNHNGTRLIVLGDDGVAHVWNVNGLEKLTELKHPSGEITSIDVAPDGAHVVTAGSDGTARLWDIAKELESLTVAETFANHAVFSPDGTQLATTSTKRSVQLWNAFTGDVERDLGGEWNDIFHLAFSPKGDRLVAAAYGGRPLLWDLKTGDMRALDGHTYHPTFAAFDPTGSLLVTADEDGVARLWEADTGAASFVLDSKSEAIRHAAFNADGNRLITSSGGIGNQLFGDTGDGAARIWDAQTGAPLLSIDEGSVLFATFGPKDDTVATVSKDGVARIWDGRTGTLLTKMEGHKRAVQHAAFSRDGARLVTSSSDKTSRIWDVETGEELAVLSGHKGAVHYAEFSHDGNRVVTASQDGTSRVWGSASGVALTALTHEEAVQSATFSPDGDRVATVSQDGTTRLWRVLPAGQRLIDLAKAMAPRQLRAEERRRFFLSEDLKPL